MKGLIFVHMKKIMKKYLEIYFKKPGKIMEISWNFVSPEKWEPCLNMIEQKTNLINVILAMTSLDLVIGYKLNKSISGRWKGPEKIK